MTDDRRPDRRAAVPGHGQRRPCDRRRGRRPTPALPSVAAAASTTSSGDGAASRDERGLRARPPGRHAVAVSSETLLLVERAIDAWRLTGGSFDPTVLGAVIRPATTARSTSSRPHRGPGRATWSRVAPTSASRRRRAPTGRHRLRSRRDRQGAGRRPRRRRDHGRGRRRRVRQPRWRPPRARRGRRPADRRAGPSPSSTPGRPNPSCLGLHDGAVATSTTLRRRWDVDGTPATTSSTRHRAAVRQDLTLRPPSPARPGWPRCWPRPCCCAAPPPFDLSAAPAPKRSSSTTPAVVSDGLTAFTGGVLPGPIPVPG